ncbi:retrovirus-related pol polyprotein from transposon TNT 1-94 [Tanacetum coccineum]
MISKKRPGENNEAKMVIYNALPRKEYERIFMCNTAKEIWKTLLITIKFVISEDESIDSAFARFNTIITSLKALDEGYSSKNYVRKFLKALHPKWEQRSRKLTESKDLTSYLLMNYRICLGVDLEPDEWIKDSGCSKHMTGNRKLFSTYKAYNGGNVIFGSNLRGNIIGKGQICDNKCKVTFSEHDSEITKNGKVIGTKWVFRNKLHENGIVSQNKARLVAQGYNQQEGIDYDETYAPVARLESIRILLAYACVLDFKLFQMDVKSAFLNGFINEEVYVAQSPGFIDFEKPDHVYKLKKALYGLKQAPKAWYDRLKAFLIKHEYKMGMVDNTLFTKKKSSNLIIVQIYVDDIIFGSTCQDMRDEFVKIMHDKFKMSMMGELNFFLGLQIKQMKDGIFFNQSKYIKEMLKKFSLEDSKPMKTPMSSDTKLTKDEECDVCLCARFQEAPKISHLEAVKRIFRYIKGTTHLGLWYPKGTGIETVLYADSDHAGDYVDRKSTSGICTFVGCCLTSWFSKKQTALAISTTEAEYRLDELAYGTPSDGPYQTNLPSIEDIILSIQINRDGQVRRIHHKEEIDVLEYQVLTREIDPTLKPLEEIIWENVFCLGSYVLYDRVMTPLAAQLEQKPRRDRGTRRVRHSTSSSSAFDQPCSSHLNDDDDDGNDEGTLRASTPSPIRYVNSLTNQVLQVFQNPPNIDPYLEPFYTRQTEIINHQVQLRDEQRGGVRSIRKSLRRLWRNMLKEARMRELLMRANG